MAKGIALKFDRNILLDLILCRLNRKHYKVSTDLYYECELTLAQNSIIKEGQNPVQNKLESHSKSTMKSKKLWNRF